MYSKVHYYFILLLYMWRISEWFSLVPVNVFIKCSFVIMCIDRRKLIQILIRISSTDKRGFADTERILYFICKNFCKPLESSQNQRHAVTHWCCSIYMCYFHRIKTNPGLYPPSADLGPWMQLTFLIYYDLWRWQMWIFGHPESHETKTSLYLLQASASPR